MSRKPLDREVARATARRDKAAAMLAAEDAALEALLKAQAELFEAVAANHELHSVPSRPIVQEMLGQNDSRALKIAKSRSPKRGRAPEVQAIYDAGLTPNGAAQLCGTTRDVLKQAWGVGSQFREIKPEWKKRLAKAGVPETVWRSRG